MVVKPTFVYDNLKLLSLSHLLYSFQGEIDESITSEITSVIDFHFNENNVPSERRRKFLLIMVECVQNVFHHQLKYPLKSDGHDSGVLISYDGDAAYRIVSGNFIENKFVDGLSTKIEFLNAMSVEQLRTYYQESLAVAELSEKGGAGLGILDMARKSKMPLEYKFIEIDERFSFFILAINVL